jgi:stage II sporulation protein AA (anti-sigma F factor antagonist)
MDKHILLEKRGDTLVGAFVDSKITGELATTMVNDELDKIVRRSDCKKLVLNFSNVRFASSAMLGKLLGLNRRLKDDGGHLTLCEVSPDIRRVFGYANLETILDIRERSEMRLRDNAANKNGQAEESNEP